MSKYSHLCFFSIHMNCYPSFERKNQSIIHDHSIAAFFAQVFYYFIYVLTNAENRYSEKQISRSKPWICPTSSRSGSVCFLAVISFIQQISAPIFDSICSRKSSNDQILERAGWNPVYQELCPEPSLLHPPSPLQPHNLCFHIDDFFGGQPRGFFPLYWCSLTTISTRWKRTPKKRKKGWETYKQHE